MEFLDQGSEMLEISGLLDILFYIEEMQFIGLATNAACKQQDIAFLPGNLLGREFVTRSRRRHRNGDFKSGFATKIEWNQEIHSKDSQKVINFVRVALLN